MVSAPHHLQALLRDDAAAKGLQVPLGWTEADGAETLETKNKWGLLAFAVFVVERSICQHPAGCGLRVAHRTGFWPRLRFPPVLSAGLAQGCAHLARLHSADSRFGEMGNYSTRRRYFAKG